ncbi:MAG: nicotinate-nucleotide--dimethylbenzimidazole phosphoribosyltransferase [Cellvibrionaceae bacterium]
MKQWYNEPVSKIDQNMRQKARAYQAVLTKPVGSLGQLETIAEDFCAWQSTLKPTLNNIKVAVFAGDHGVTSQGVSAFPQAVTVQMITNFLEGGAAISVLSRDLNANFSVLNMGTAFPIPDDYAQHPQLVNVDIAKGTSDFSSVAAMTENQLDLALNAGRNFIIKDGLDDSIEKNAAAAVVSTTMSSTAKASTNTASTTNTKADLFVGGEMGIGNTTSASAIYAALLSLPAKEVVGVGTGVDAEGLLRKQAVIEKALKCHKEKLHDPYEILRCLGGLEIAGLVGSYIACAQKGIPVLVDGFICTAAALVAVKMNPRVRDWLLFSHQSAEAAHHKALQFFQAEALLKLGLRLGEGSGAALAVPLLRSALSLHNNMATFAEASVSEQS